MKRTALILAGAAAFDLGVMAVAAQAQEQRSAPADDYKIGGTALPQSPGTPSGSAVRDPGGPGGTGGTGGCTPGGAGSGCPGGPAAISDQAAAGNLTAIMPTAQSDGQTSGRTHRDHKGETAIFIKMDRVNTLQACTARQGQVVTHEGVQQCRIPTAGAAAPTIGNPTRRPGGVPPRN